MDNKMAVFNNREFGSIRVIEENGNYLFCGFDVAKALGYAKPRNAINTHCKGALKRGALTEGGVQELTFIPEGDVYRLIVHSRLPGAERFEKWVFDEVLPMIRKTGGYMTASLLEQAAEKPEIRGSGGSPPTTGTAEATGTGCSAPRTRNFCGWITSPLSAIPKYEWTQIPILTPNTSLTANSSMV